MHASFLPSPHRLPCIACETTGKITTLTPSKSFSVQIGAAVAVLSSTVLGLAVSTSHCLVGSVVGVGLAAKISRAGGGLNGKILLKSASALVSTHPHLWDPSPPCCPLYALPCSPRDCVWSIHTARAPQFLLAGR